MESAFDNECRKLIFTEPESYVYECKYFHMQCTMIHTIMEFRKDLVKNFETFSEFKLDDQKNGESREEYHERESKRAFYYSTMIRILTHPYLLDLLDMAKDSSIIKHVFKYLKEWTFVPSKNEISEKILKFVNRFGYFYPDYLATYSKYPIVEDEPDSYHLFKVMRKYRDFDKHLLLEVMKFEPPAPTRNLIKEVWEDYSIFKYMSTFPKRGIRLPEVEYDDYVTILSKEGTYLPPVRRRLFRIFHNHPDITGNKMYTNEEYKSLFLLVIFMEKPELYTLSYCLTYIDSFFYHWKIDDNCLHLRMARIGKKGAKYILLDQ